MDLNEFQHFLTNFKQSNNEIIQQSTEFYQNALLENPSAIITLHLQNILSFQDQYLTSISIILLKRAFVDSEFFFKINEETIGFISEALPKLFENENLTPNLFSLLIDTSSLIAVTLMKHEKMLNFIPHLVKIVKSMSPTLSPPSLNCIVQCNNYKPLTNFETGAETYILISLEDVYLTIGTALTNDFSIDFTIAALRMLFSFYKDNNLTPQLNEFAQAVSEIYSSIPEQNLAIALSDLYVFCKHTCAYFSQTLPTLISTLLSIVGKYNGNADNGPHIQTLAINIFICLAQSYGIEFKPFLSDVVASVFVASCNFSEDSMQDDIELNSPYSDKAIFWLSELFSSRTEYQTLVIKLSQEMIQREEWNCRRSALSAIYQLLNSCETGLDAYFNDILKIVQEHLGDPNHLCRYYSFKSLSILCISYSLFVNQYIQTLIPLIIAVSKAEVHHETKIAELKSLELICSNVPSESILPLSQSIIEELLPQIEDPNSTPMEQLMVIKCMSEIALSTEKNFDQFYSQSISWLKTAIGQIQPGGDDLVRVESIKTIPLVGKIVNLELFLDDGVGFLNLLLGDTFFISGENEKSSILYLIQEMSKILPREIFSQFIPSIFNMLETVLSKELEVAEFPLSYDISSLSDQILIPLRNENIIISYSRPQLNLNKECINTVIILIENLKDMAIPFARSISKVASKFIKSAYFSPIQVATLKLFDSLINLYREFDNSLFSLFLSYVRGTLFPNISNFFTNPISVLCESFDLLSHSMEGSQFDGYFTSLLDCFLFEQLPIKRMRVLNKSSNENSPELISLDELEISIEKFAKALLELFPQNMIESSPILLHSQCSVFHILYSTDIYLAMSNTENNLVNLDQLMSTIFESLSSSRMNLCYASLISLSKIIQKGTFDSDFIQQSIDKIINIIQQYEEDEDDLLRKVIDGALIALASIFKITYGKIDLSSIIPIWFKQMPVLLDDPESNIAFEAFCTFLTDKNPQIFNPELLTHLLECCCEAITLKEVSTGIKDQLIAILKELFSDEGMATLVQKAVFSLTIRDRKILQNVIY